MSGKQTKKQALKRQVKLQPMKKRLAKKILKENRFRSASYTDTQFHRAFLRMRPFLDNIPTGAW